MNIIPMPKKVTEHGGEISLLKLNWIFESCDERVKNAALSVCPSSSDGVNVYIDFKNSSSEEYTLTVEKDRINISANGAAGAFYALQTLKQLRMQNGGMAPICEIYDKPDLAVRGYYFDITRGRVPKLEHLKQIVDSLAFYKINMLQLYVENVYEFEEYKGIAKPENCITSEEIKEIDAYCKDRFIEFVPSLATFGHLYDLLQSEKYSHLCELENYVPKTHYWGEKMAHHTIDVSNPESIELIKSLIDQYSKLFQSNNFNICCDETFDLCKGRNAAFEAKDKYIEFVKKIADHLKSNNQKVQMWADIVLKYPEKMNVLGDNVEFLNWDYAAEPYEENIKKIHDSGAVQILCPGCDCWSKFTLGVGTAEKNISKISGYAKKYNVKGILNTAWGDFGHIGAWNGHCYGMILGAEKSWNLSDELPTEEFKKTVCVLQFGTKEVNVIDSLENVAKVENCIWNRVVQIVGNEGRDKSWDPKADELNEMVRVCREEEKKLAPYSENECVNDIIISIEGTEITALAALSLSGETVDGLSEKYAAWFEKYIELWNRESKPSELWRIKEFTELITANR